MKKKKSSLRNSSKFRVGVEGLGHDDEQLYLYTLSYSSKSATV